MIAAGLLANLLTLSLGVVAAHRCWPATDRRSGADWALLVFLGWAIGAGITSGVFFLCSLVTSHPGMWSAIIEIVLLIGGAGCPQPPRVSSASQTPAQVPDPARWGRHAPPLVSWLLGSLLVQCAVAALVLSLRAARLEPFGSWDGWAIWNLHARFLFRAGPDWPAALAAPELNWTHADYPWLLSAGVARVWSWMGRESPLGSAAFGGCFGVATVGVLGTALCRRRGPIAALVAGLVLIGTPAFVAISSNEHADIPFGLYVLASCVLIAEAPSPSRGLALLTGLVIGFAPFVKNEGLLWLPVATVGWLAASHRWSALSPTRTGPNSDKRVGDNALHLSNPRYRYFLAGLVLALLPLLYFKLHLAPTNDLAGSHPADRLAQLFVPERHRIILASLRRDLLGFGNWRWIPFIPLALALIGAGWRRLTGSEALIAVLLLVMFAGYYVVYLLTPFDLHWHLDSSLVRLLLQLWPAALFGWGLAASLPLASPRRPGRPGLWLAGNVVAAAAVVVSLNQHLAPGELARSSWQWFPVHASAGDGWYPAERQGSVRWVWSSGHAALRLDSSRGQTVRPSFKLRGLQDQQITVQWQGRTIWAGTVGVLLQKVTLPEFAVPAGGGELIFSSDRPGVTEASTLAATRSGPPIPPPRALAFALYQLQIE